MIATIQKWGNSLAVRIPRAFTHEAQVAPGTRVDLSMVDGKIVIDPHSANEYSLDDLLAGITDANLHTFPELRKN